MQALVYTGEGAVELTERSEPRLQPGHARVRIRACGICHTDIDILNGRYGAGAFPLVPGHEFSGVVEAVAEDVTALAPGERVVVDPNIPCGACRPCARGLTNLCETLAAYGVTGDGGFAEVAVVHADNLHRIGDMPFALAALAEPLACVLNGLDVAGTTGVQTALVFGAGPIGLLLALALQARGVPDVAVCDRDEARLRLVESFALTPLAAGSDALARRRRDVDFVADATGVPAVAESLTDYAANGGTALVFGVCPPQARIAVSPFDVFRRQLKIVGAHSLNRNIPEALAMLAEHGETMGRMVSHHAPLADIGAFLTGERPRGALKIHYANP